MKLFRCVYRAAAAVLHADRIYRNVHVWVVKKKNILHGESITSALSVLHPSARAPAVCVCVCAVKRISLSPYK